MSLTLMRNTGAIVDPDGRLVVRIVYADDAMAWALLAAASAEWERRHPPEPPCTCLADAGWGSPRRSCERHP